MVQQLRDSIPLDFLNSSSFKLFGNFRSYFNSITVELKLNGKVTTWHFSDRIDSTDAKLKDARIFAAKVARVHNELEKD